MKKLLFTLLLTITICTSYAQSLNVFFATDSDILRSADLIKLQGFISQTDSLTGTFQLVGHADARGNSQYNLDLSKRRVEAVKTYLISLGMTADEIQTDYVGEQEATETNPFYSRRVSLTFQKNQAKLTTVSEFLSSIKPETQVLNVPSNRNVLVEGAKGTVIKIKKNSFVFEDGSDVTGEVQLELEEYYSMLDFYSENLTTKSGDQLIESGGMIRLAASSEGKALKIRDGQSIELNFPKSSDSTFQTFYGKRLADGSMDWEVEKEDLATLEKRVEDGKQAFLNYSFKDTKYKSDTTIATRLTVVEEVLAETEPIYSKEDLKIADNLDKYYQVLYTERLGSINCDRFLKARSTVLMRLNLQVTNQNIIPVSSHLFFKRINSILMLLPVDKSYVLGMKVPRNQEVSVLILAQDTETDQLLFYHDNLKVARDMKRNITLKETTFEEVKALIVR